jgi:hypothetical protein
MATNLLQPSNNASHSTIHFIQANLNHCREATLNLIRATHYLNAVLLIQEPYHYRGSLPLWPKQYSIIHNGTKSTAPTAAIIVTSHNIPHYKLSQMSSPHCVAIELCLPDLTCVAASAYLSPSVGLKHSLEALERLTACVDSRELIIGVDANAHSQLWHHPSNSPRGNELADWIQTANLLLGNFSTTFSSLLCSLNHSS